MAVSSVESNSASPQNWNLFYSVGDREHFPGPPSAANPLPPPGCREGSDITPARPGDSAATGTTTTL